MSSPRRGSTAHPPDPDVYPPCVPTTTQSRVREPLSPEDVVLAEEPIW